MRPRLTRAQQNHKRGGFTLLEMLVVVALVVLLMSILVSIFSAATSAISVSRAYQELDQNLRMVDGTLRRDLLGVTARLTPPLDPKNNLGYFEYGEGAFADVQGEDTDDYLRFTSKAPEGQPFIGRLWVVNGNPNVVNPITFTSDYAEIIYFLRDGKLYRRVLLIAPQRTTSLSAPLLFTGFPWAAVGNFTSWQGANDISSRPDPFANAILQRPIANTLGDLTNRENRFASPRFCDDLTPVDGVSDDSNGDGVPDYYPTLYPNAVINQTTVHDNPLVNNRVTTVDVMPFPYIFPGMYSQSVALTATDGPLHSLDPTGTTFNHSPLEIGDSLAIPVNANQRQTWWGFPTWRETAAPAWADPIHTTNNNLAGALHSQSTGLSTGGQAFPFLNPTLPPSSSPFSDPTVGTLTFSTTPAGQPPVVWEDDLIMTNVRSFDIKAFDPLIRGYEDLGYLGKGPLGTNGVFYQFTSLAQAVSLLQGLGHEGRIPPLPVNPVGSTNGTGDYRYNPQGTLVTANDFARFDVGDNLATTLRLRRVFDTWSTEYTRAPWSSWINPTNGPDYGGPPIYPSFPPPYPAPLRGIQIQIRVADPQNAHVKVLTIRQDFADKL